MKTQENPATLYFPTVLKVALTGAWKLTLTASEATLEYTDGKTETVPADAMKNIDIDDWFSVVSKVQSFRTK
jgi:hypothetical protein